MRNLYASRNGYDDRGVSILIIAVSMVFILGIAGLGIDLASLYVGRNQAQRAADAGALAAAQYIAKQCTAGSGTLTADCQAKAKNKAVAVTNANLIAGVTPNITAADVTFLETSANDPQVQVIAGRDTSHTNPMPTFFVKIFGINSANVSAKAVAEAYNPAGGGPPVGATCLKPWLMPNCDWPHKYDQTKQIYDNPACFGSAQFLNNNPPSQEFSTDLVNPGAFSAGGVQGEPIQIKSSDPSQASGPSQFYPVYLPPGGIASVCPSCSSGGSPGTGPSSGAYYRQNIECCNTTQINCGSQTIQPITGNMVGPTAQGVDCLIHEKGGAGQDLITVPGTSGDLWTITAGSANPYGQTGPIDTSDSIVTLPLYDGTPLCPGGSCPSQSTITVVGYLQLFINGESSGNVNGTVMNVIPCPATSGSGSGSPPVIASGGSSPVPVRLIHQ